MADQDQHQQHLGDGVYVSFDGYNINVAVNHHENHVVALEPEVIERLLKYVEMIKAEK